LVLAIALTIAVGVGAYLWWTLANPILLDAPRPAVTSDSANLVPPIRPSIVEAPVTYDISAAVDSFERAVPRTFGDIDNRLQFGDNPRAHFSFLVSRSPFRVHVEGLAISIASDIEYEARGWYRPVIGPEISAACGTGGVPRPRVRATITSTARLTSDWQLRTQSRVAHLEPLSTDPRDRCRVTVFRIDITDRVIEATQHVLEQNLAKFDRAIAEWNTRSRFEQLWRQLQRPIRLTDSVYLVINPFAAQLGSIGAEGNTVVAHLRLIASPRVLTGAYPNEFERMHPIPPLEKATEVGSGAHVLMDASFSYPVATVLLRRVLVGKKVEQSGRHVRIRDVELSGIGGGRVALGVTLAGAARGRLYFTGTPMLDRVNRQVYVPDLDYDVGSATLLARGFEWLRGIDIRDFLRAHARLPDSALVGRLRELAEHGMNRTLTPGVELSAQIQHAEGTDVVATTQEIHVRAVADADLKLAISRAPALRLPATSANKKGG
jgi:uncharacterized protein DUF4403